MIKLMSYLALIFLIGCSDDQSLFGDNDFGGYNDPRYFENIGLNKNPLGQNVSENIDDLNIQNLFSENKLAKIFILGYYQCPQMCNSFREVLFPELVESNLTLGEDYEIVMLSINPRETYIDAKKDGDKYFSLFFKDKLKREYLNFAISEEQSTKDIAEKLGFQYRYDQEVGEYYHPTVAYVLLADGTVSDIIDFAERSKSIEGKVDLANKGYVSNLSEYEALGLTCMAKNIENKNPREAFALAQFGGAWFVCCSVFCFGYNLLSRREKNKEK